MRAVDADSSPASRQAQKTQRLWEDDVWVDCQHTALIDNWYIIPSADYEASLLQLRKYTKSMQTIKCPDELNCPFGTWPSGVIAASPPRRLRKCP